MLHNGCADCRLLQLAGGCHTDLLDVTRRAEVLSTVISVVSSKAEQLLVTLGLGVVVVYLYSVVGFLTLHDQYEIDGKIGCNWLVRVRSEPNATRPKCP